METGSIRCVIYCRISKDLAGDEHGVGNQLEECRRYARARGWVIVAEYADNDICATYGKRRPGYDDMMRAVQAGGISAIVIFHTSRLWRNRKERAEGIEILRKAAVSVQAAKGPSLDMTTAYGRGMADLIGSFDSIEVENRVGGGVAPPPLTPPDMRVRIRRFVRPLG